jgi:hypothetical protein
MPALTLYCRHSYIALFLFSGWRYTVHVHIPGSSRGVRHLDFTFQLWSLVYRPEVFFLLVTSWTLLSREETVILCRWFELAFRNQNPHLLTLLQFRLDLT